MIPKLLSYIYGISEYNIDYGYLVYWKYELYDKIPNIVSCNVLKINRTSENRTRLLKKYSEISQVIKNKGDYFDPQDRKASKCAGCANGLFCGHKTGKFNKYSLPYKANFLKLNFTPFPTEFKRQDNEIK
ncbi:MAG: hypothetical protein STSR0008_18670 [Ignavibacterium sp.]